MEEQPEERVVGGMVWYRVLIEHGGDVDFLWGYLLQDLDSTRRGKPFQKIDKFRHLFEGERFLRGGQPQPTQGARKKQSA